MNLFSLPSCEHSIPNAWQSTFLLDGHSKKNIYICAVLWWQTLVPIWVLPLLILEVTSIVTLPPFSSVKSAQKYLCCSVVVRIRDKSVKCIAHNYGFNFLSAYSYYEVFGTEENLFLTQWPSVMLNYSILANAHPRGTIVNSWIRVLFTLGREGISILSFQMRPSLAWQHMKELPGRESKVLYVTYVDVQTQFHLLMTHLSRAHVQFKKYTWLAFMAKV